MPGRLQPVRPLPLPQRITDDWAFGGSTGSGVTVAVVDSGIERGHPMIGAVDGFAAFALADDGTQVQLDTTPHDDVVGHGTACASIIRAVAPDVRLLSVRVLGDRMSGRSPVFAAGLRWALQSGAQIVNCSLSSTRRENAPIFHEIADMAAHAGVILVCAVNNVPGASVPATFSSVVSVAAHEDLDASSWYVNPQPPVEFAAPGIDVVVGWRGGGTIVTTGNSFAAPHITGHVARLLAKHPGLAPYEVKTVLRACARNAAHLT